MNGWMDEWTATWFMYTVDQYLKTDVFGFSVRFVGVPDLIPPVVLEDFCR